MVLIGWSDGRKTLVAEANIPQWLHRPQESTGFIMQGVEKIEGWMKIQHTHPEWHEVRLALVRWDFTIQGNTWTILKHANGYEDEWQTHWELRAAPIFIQAVEGLSCCSSTSFDLQAAICTIIPHDSQPLHLEARNATRSVVHHVVRNLQHELKGIEILWQGFLFGHESLALISPEKLLLKSPVNISPSLWRSPICHGGALALNFLLLGANM